MKNIKFKDFSRAGQKLLVNAFIEQASDKERINNYLGRSRAFLCTSIFDSSRFDRRQLKVVARQSH